MRDIMIKNGDTVINSSGSTVLLEGLDAKFQQAVICISAKLGGFVYDRELGSTVALQSKTLSAKQLELLANESLAEMENAFASIKDVGGRCTLNDFKQFVRGYGAENFTIKEIALKNRVNLKIFDTKTDAEKKYIKKCVNADFPLHLNVVVLYEEP